MREIKALSKTIVAVSTAAFLCAGAIGCQTAAKLAWWKSGDKANIESTALAHSAPALPADVAKQAENFAKAAPSIEMTGGEAAPYSQAPPFSPVASHSAAATASSVPAVGSNTNAAVAGFPSTGASPYSAATAPSSAATTPFASAARVSTDDSANLGSVDMPYDPRAVPPARSVAAAPSISPSATTDRYGLASQAAPVGSGSTRPIISGAMPGVRAAIDEENASRGTLARGAQEGTTNPTATVAAPAVPQLAGTDRYANIKAAPTQPISPTVPPAGVQIASTTLGAPDSTNRSPATAPAYSGSRYATSAPAAPGITNTSSDLSGSRYASSDGVPTGGGTAGAGMTPGGQTPSPAAMTSSSPVANDITPTSVAVAQVSPTPYRPGGTDSYRGSATGATAVEIASRPNLADQQTPNSASTSSAAGSNPASTPAQAPRYR